MLLTCASGVASTVGEGLPPGLAPVPVIPAVVQPVLRGDNLGELERQQRLRELRRQLLEHSRSSHADAALRRSAAMPEPGDSPAVIADKILPLAPLPASEAGRAAGATASPAQPLAAPGTSRLPSALPDAVPEALAAPVAPALPAAPPPGPGTAQAAAVPLEAGRVSDAAGVRDHRLTELERRQLRQLLRTYEPTGR